MSPFLYIFVILTFVLQTNFVSAKASFMPILIGYAGDITVKGGYDYIENNTGSSKTYDRTQLFRESLNLATAGYVYHPNLLFFQLDGSGYYEQERNGGNLNGNYSSSEATYGIEGKVFRKKPLNAKFYAKQERPFLVNSDRDDRVEEASTSGVSFKYRKQGLMSTVKYDRRDEKRSNSATRTDDYDAYVSYYVDEMVTLKDVNLSAWGLHQERKEVSDNTFNNLNLNASFKYKFLEFSNIINYRDNDSSTELSEQYGLNHRVFAQLPWNFTSGFQYSLTQNDTERKGLDSDVVVSTSDSERYTFDLTQKLFSSLVTKFRSKLDKRESSSGGSEEKEYSVDTQYTKKLPKGSSIHAGLGSKTTWDERDGQLAVTDKIESAHAGGSFFLDIDADPDSLLTISVLKDNTANPANDSSWILMQEGLAEGGHYDVDRSVIPIKVTISNILFDRLRAEGLLDPAPEMYTFKTNYFFNDADYTIKTDRSDFFINFNLFGRVTADYYHTLLRQEFDEGDLGFRDTEIIAPKSTDDQLSLRANYGSFAGYISYQTLKSSTSQDTVTLSASYKKDEFPILFNFIRSGLSIDSSYKNITTNKSDSSDKETLTNAIYDFWALATVPKVKVVVTFDSSYEYLRGDVQIIRFTDSTSRLGTLTGLDDRDIFLNSITLNRHFKEPRTKIKTSVWGKGSWDRTTGSEDTFAERYEFGVKANRSWVFGGTTFTLNARHEFVENKINDYQANIENVSTRIETKILLKVVRKLF